jgi:uncharacterized membrane protein YfcA
VAGGGSFIALPALLLAGVPPVSANATTTFAMWPGSVASVVAYRREMSAAWSWMLRLGVVSLAGGLTGGLLLVKTSDESFMRLLPWLMLLDATTFTFGGRMTAWARRRRPAAAPAFGRAHGADTARDTGAGAATAGSSPQVPLWTLPLQLLIATYGGYFGGGMGIMMLAAMAVAGMTDMHEMNGLKSLLAVAINGVALAAFVADGAISWAPGMVMVAGGITGGYVGASMARRVSGPAVRVVVITVAWAMTGYFFLR